MFLKFDLLCLCFCVFLLRMPISLPPNCYLGNVFLRHLKVVRSGELTKKLLFELIYQGNVLVFLYFLICINKCTLHLDNSEKSKCYNHAQLVHTDALSASECVNIWMREESLACICKQVNAYQNIADKPDKKIKTLSQICKWDVLPSC